MRVVDWLRLRLGSAVRFIYSQGPGALGSGRQRRVRRRHDAAILAAAADLKPMSSEWHDAKSCRVRLVQERKAAMSQQPGRAGVRAVQVQR